MSINNAPKYKDNHDYVPVKGDAGIRYHALQKPYDGPALSLNDLPMTEHEFDDTYIMTLTDENNSTWEEEDLPSDVDEKHVWAIIEQDDEDQHLVPGWNPNDNPIGYVITENPWETGDERALYVEYPLDGDNPAFHEAQALQQIITNSAAKTAEETKTGHLAAARAIAVELEHRFPDAAYLQLNGDTPILLGEDGQPLPKQTREVGYISRLPQQVPATEVEMRNGDTMSFHDNDYSWIQVLPNDVRIVDLQAARDVEVDGL